MNTSVLKRVHSPAPIKCLQVIVLTYGSIECLKKCFGTGQSKAAMYGSDINIPSEVRVRDRITVNSLYEII